MIDGDEDVIITNPCAKPFCKKNDAPTLHERCDFHYGHVFIRLAWNLSIDETEWAIKCQIYVVPTESQRGT